jgi:hypothetical protein
MKGLGGSNPDNASRATETRAGATPAGPTINLGALTRAERDRYIHCVFRWMDAQREGAGLCRHCGDALPCWSGFGDYAPGRRHTTRTYRKVMRERSARIISCARAEEEKR